MDKKVTIKPSKEKKVNQFGKPIVENWCLYVRKLTDRQRLEEQARRKEATSVSKITEKDKCVFKDAWKKLMKQRAAMERQRCSYLKKLTASRCVRSKKCRKPVEKDECDPYVPCVIDYKREGTCKPALERLKPQRSMKKGKQKVQINYPPIKTRPWHPPGPPKRKQRPVVVVPPFKRRPFVPCSAQTKPNAKPVIEYPPITLRKT